MTMMKKQWLLLLAAVVPLFCSAFTTTPSTTRRSSFAAVASSSTTRLAVGPLQKLTNKKEYNTVVEGLMRNKGYTREQAEKEYNMYLDNPNDYALQKGEAYYKGLGYKSLMEGVIGEAEKEGKGDEVRARIEDFNKKSKLKGLATITFFIALFFYYKLSYVPPIVPGGGL